ncbi:AMP-binding protein [Nocardioides convexus]|uniref:AMP-binding protein n=1 Tax=Nocardioides convexus TaxID=2712224 RepID=UPI0024181DB3|nr:AMP-binding protein [Nocardioides convexus]
MRARLVARGVRRGDVVAVVLPRSEQQAVALLAVARAGGVYLPIDQRHPEARRAALVADSGARCVVDLDVVGAADRGSDLQVPRRSSAVPCGRAMRRTSSTPRARPGGPRGWWCRTLGCSPWPGSRRRLLGVTSSSRVLRFASAGFDASMHEVAKTWWAGATLVVPPEDVRLIGPDLTEVLRRERITHATLPPTAIVETDLPSDVVAGLTLMTAGEACTPAVVAATRRAGRVLNGYGPTEATVCATVHELGPDTDERAVPIGTPIEGTEVHLLDDDLQPVPLGRRGEIYLSGDKAGVGLPRPRARHRRALRRQPVRAARQPDVPHRRSRPPAARRLARLRRPGGPPGQGPRAPRRARGGRRRTGDAARGPALGGARGPSWGGPGAGGAHRCRAWRPSSCRRVRVSTP